MMKPNNFGLSRYQPQKTPAWVEALIVVAVCVLIVVMTAWGGV